MRDCVLVVKVKVGQVDMVPSVGPNVREKHALSVHDFVYTSS